MNSAKLHFLTTVLSKDDDHGAALHRSIEFSPIQLGDGQMGKAFLRCVVLVYSLWAYPIWAAITTAGDVAPAPPGAGGNVVGPFNVGNTGTGTMSIAGGTALTSTNQAFVGFGPDAVGIVTMSG